MADKDIGNKDPNASQKEVPAAKKVGVEVKALRDGFFKRMRKKTGDIFHVPKLEDCGSWMEPTDPALAKKHAEAMKAKKEKSKKVAGA